MEMYELETLMDNLYLVDKSSWEQTRTLGYFICQVNSKRKLSPSKIMSFPWETESDSDPEKLTEEEKEKRDQEWKAMEESVRNMVRK